MADTASWRISALELTKPGIAPEPPFSTTQNSGAIWHTIPEHWPKASRDYVFLAQAFHEVGRALFAGEWTGREGMSPQMPVYEAIREATTQRRSFAPTPIRPISSGLSMTRSDGRSFTMEDVAAAKRRFEAECYAKWTAAQPELEAEAAALAQMMYRRMKVAQWIAEKARDGDLATYGLWTGGGYPVRELLQSVWFRKYDWELFANCEVKTQLPGDSMACNYFLFFTRESLNRALSAGAGKASAEGRAEALLRSRAEPTKGKGLSRAELEAEAICSIPGLSKRAFGRAWERVANDFPEMRMPGPRPTVG